LAWLTLILFFVVPLIGFIVWLIRRITRARSKSNYLSWTFGGLWALGWVVGTFFVVSIIRDFREYEHVDIPVALTQPINNKLVVAVSKPELEYTGRFGWMRDGSDGWDLEDDTLKIAAVKFSVKASPDSQYHVMVKKYGFGKTNDDAFSRAEKILFDVVSRDSVLDIDNGYAIDSKSKFRFQNVEIEILVPPGKKIMFDESVDRKLNSMNIKVTRSNRRDRITGLEFHPDEDGFNFRTGIEYVMGINGELKAPNGIIANPGNDYRYNGNTDSLELERSIEKKKQELKELEEKKIKKKTTTLKKITKKKNLPSYATAPTTPALTEWF